MTAVAIKRTILPERGRGRPQPSLFEDEGREPTLDEMLGRAWEGLAAHRSVPCPVCGEEMRPEYGTHALQPDDPRGARTGEAVRRAGRVPEGGRCRGCETGLT